MTRTLSHSLLGLVPLLTAGHCDTDKSKYISCTEYFRTWLEDVTQKEKSSPLQPLCCPSVLMFTEPPVRCERIQILARY